MEVENVSFREFGRRIGKSHVWAQQLAKKNIIPRNPDGSIPFKAAFEAYNKYLTDKGEPAIKWEKPRRGRTDESIDDAANELYKTAETSAKVSTALNKAKLAEKTFQAKLKELEYKLKRGELLERADVATEAAALADSIKTRLLSIPPRISALCEGRVAREIEEIITDSINDALKDLQKLKYEKVE